MQTKSTEELNHEIMHATDIEDLLENNQENLISSTLTAHMCTRYFPGRKRLPGIN